MPTEWRLPNQNKDGRRLDTLDRKKSPSMTNVKEILFYVSQTEYLFTQLVIGVFEDAANTTRAVVSVFK